MKENVEKILQFISAKKIRLHHVAAKGTLLHFASSVGVLCNHYQ